LLAIIKQVCLYPYAVSDCASHSLVS
jgi:hypothetical protein